jgi:hypothetical protein
MNFIKPNLHKINAHQITQNVSFEVASEKGMLRETTWDAWDRIQKIIAPGEQRILCHL